MLPEDNLRVVICYNTENAYLLFPISGVSRWVLSGYNPFSATLFDIVKLNKNHLKKTNRRHFEKCYDPLTPTWIRHC